MEGQQPKKNEGNEGDRPAKRFRMDENTTVNIVHPFPLAAGAGVSRAGPAATTADAPAPSAPSEPVFYPGPEVDLAAQQMHDLSLVEFGPDVIDLDLMENRLREFSFKITGLKKLQILCVRQNLFKDASGVGAFESKGTLRELVMHDNLLTALPSFQGFTALTKVDFSYNEIKSMAPVSSLAGSASSLKELYLASNKVGAIEGLESLTALETLELGSNRLRTLEGLHALHGLQNLWLGRNRIADLATLPPLTSLVKISLQSNRLESMKGLEACVNLEELYISHNGIWKLEGLENLTKLRVLDAGNNRISTLEGLTAQKHMTDLWINDNRLEDLDHLRTALGVQRYTITTIYLEGNPVVKKTQNYKEKIIEILPNLCFLDSDAVK